jgi:hypothetical protein
MMKGLRIPVALSKKRFFSAAPKLEIAKNILALRSVVHVR